MQIDLSWLFRPRTPKPAACLSEKILENLWNSLQCEYFPDRTDLLVYTIEWSSRRQKRTLASCNVKRKKVLVARELDDTRFSVWLAPLLYHEMCHAVLGDEMMSIQGRRPWHGREFRALERRHPLIPELDRWIRSGGWLSAVRSSRARRRYEVTR